MSHDDPIREYLAQFARRLSARGLAGRRVLEEIECHLRELADRLYIEGMEPAAAARAAIERFGTPDDVLRQFELEAPIESEVIAMIRFLLTPIAALSFLFGALLLIMCWFDDAPPAMLAMKVMMSTLMLGCSSVLLHQVWSARPPFSWERELALASALLSVAIGSAGSVFTAHLGLVTKDWEYYGFGVAGLLVLQGVLATLHLLHDARTPTNLAA